MTGPKAIVTGPKAIVTGPKAIVTGPKAIVTGPKAIVIGAVLAVVAVALAATTVGLAVRGLGAAGSGGASSPPLLVMPAPERAAGLPRHYQLTTDRRALLAIAEFRRRFTALMTGATAAYPAALYGEPGRIDLATGSAGWVMYLGYNGRARLGDPAVTATMLMARLAGSPATRSRQVHAGVGGGSARCMIAVVGLTRMSVCGWATDRTMAAVMSPERDTSVTELAALMLAMRPSLQPG